MNRYCGIVVATLCLLTTAISAAAECAWIWWVQEENQFPGRFWTTWATPIAYPTRAACEAQITAYVRAWEEGKNSRQSVNRLGDTGTAAEFRTDVEGGGRTILRRYCLPDTVDPRGPKGK